MKKAKLDEIVDDLVANLPEYVSILEIKYESAIFDTNEQLDRWWMFQG